MRTPHGIAAGRSFRKEAKQIITQQQNIAPGVTLGSLFDGIGGFPYAGSFFGIKPLWASEILPQAVSVTTRRFPGMAHVGDITKLDGSKLPPVDIITFGSPCQDLSVAGKRAGLGGERSGLFNEAIRIIYEMREATHGRYPTWAVWENVPGALSSNGGLDFKAVLEAFTEAEVPLPRSGRWTNAGMVRSGGTDLAWCVYNAQHFGTAQRRRRIFLVRDFGGERSGEILFVPKSLQGYFAAGGTPRQGAPAHALRCADGAGGAVTLPINTQTVTRHQRLGEGTGFGLGNDGDPAYTLQASHSHAVCFACNQRDEVRDLHDVSAAVCAQPGMKQQTFVAEPTSQSANEKDIAATLFAGYGNHWNGNAGAYDGGNFALSPAPNCLTPWDAQSRRIHSDDGAWPALYGGEGGGRGYAAQPKEADVNCLTPWDTQQSRIFTDDGASPTLAGADGGGGRNPAGLVYTAGFCAGAGAKANGIGYEDETAPTIKAGACGFQMPTVLCAAFMGDSSPTSYGIEYCEESSPTLKPRLSGTPCLCEPKLARTLTARGDSSPCADRGQNIVAVPKPDAEFLCAATGQPNAEILDNLSATLTCYHEQPIICGAMGVSQNQCGDVNTSDTAYSLGTNGNATGRNAPLVAHPAVSGTLMASGAGMSRPAGMVSETDLCVVVPGSEPIPIHDKATRYSGGGDTRKDDGAGNGLGVGKSGDPAPTITAGDRHAVAAYALQGNMIGRQDHNGPAGSGVKDNISFALTATDAPAVASVDCRNMNETEELSGTLQAKDQGYSLNYTNPVRMGYIVRRLTPTECERLQGYPDGWTASGHDGKPISDTARYMMLGNSVAVPCVAYILMGIAEQMAPENHPGALCAGAAAGRTDEPDAHCGSDGKLFEGHGHDARFNGPLSVSPTVSAAYGEGGGNIPLVLDTV